MSKHPVKSEHERITLIEGQMETVLKQLSSVSSTLADLTATGNVSQVFFTPSFLGFQPVPLTPSSFLVASPIGLGGKLLAVAFLPAGPNTVGQAAAQLKCTGVNQAVWTEAFGPVTAGGRRSISVINSNKSDCTITVRAVAPGGGALAGGAVDPLNLGPGASGVLPATLAVREQFQIQCSTAGATKDCIYEYRIDLVP